ncbi:MAG: TRAP transporter substrate-binding protein [Rhodospirillales bacterium]
MRNVVIGMVIGVVVGVVIGATVIAPRLTTDSTTPERKAQASVVIARQVEKPQPQTKAEAVITAHTQQAQEEPDTAITGLEPEAGAVRWVMASAYPSAMPQIGAMAKRLEREIWRISAGNMDIKFHEPGTLVDIKEMFNAVASGAIDAAFSWPGHWSGSIPALGLFAAVPFGPYAEEYLAWIYFGGGKELFESIYHPQGVHGVFCGMAPAEASGWFRRKIRVPEDLKGLKIRFSGLGGKVLGKLGAEIKNLEGGDIFAAFESGDIEAAEFSMPAIDLKLGFYKMAKHYYFPGWHQPATLLELLINLKLWEELPATARSQIEGVCGDNIRYGLAEGGAAQFQALKELSAKGVEIHRWPTEVLDALEEAWMEVSAEEQTADRDFRRVWKSLSAFRRNYAIWNELGRL